MLVTQELAEKMLAKVILVDHLFVIKVARLSLPELSVGDMVAQLLSSLEFTPGTLLL